MKRECAYCHQEISGYPHVLMVEYERDTSLGLVFHNKTELVSYLMAQLGWKIQAIPPGAEAKPEEPKPEAAAPVPEFDPQELMTHEWKGKKKTEGEGYEPWNQIWGWDREDRFSQIVLQVLEKGPLLIGQYEFNWDRERKLVNVRKVKKG